MKKVKGVKRARRSKSKEKRISRARHARLESYDFIQIRHLGVDLQVIGKAAQTLALEPRNYDYGAIPVGVEAVVEFDKCNLIFCILEVRTWLIMLSELWRTVKNRKTMGGWADA